jgi:biotin carboxylase
MPEPSMKKSTTLAVFNYDFDAIGFARAAQAAGQTPPDQAGFDLFSFPSNAQLAFFDIERMVDRLAKRAASAGWKAVVSSQEQFGALTAALLAERMGWPGTSVNAVLACQHKLYARQVLERICPEASIGAQVLDAEYGAPIPEGLRYPAFVKPVKAAFSVLAKVVKNREELQRHTRFGAWELWIIRHLVEPFERVFHKRLPGNHSAHRLMVEETVDAPQFNLDGYVWQGEVQMLGVVDAVMYPGTQAFMRWDYPSQLPSDVQQRALAYAQKFLTEIGFNHGLFNMEFFHDPVTDKITIIEFNPRMAAQFSDLYLRVNGIDLHAIALALANGQHPQTLPKAATSAGVASSLVYRSFDKAASVQMPNRQQTARAQAQFPDALLMPFPKGDGAIERDFKWLGSYRYGIAHLGGRDWADLRHRAGQLSALLDWPTPFAEDQHDEKLRHAARPKTAPFSRLTESLNPLIAPIGESKT